jgi:hypothetical protein
MFLNEILSAKSEKGGSDGGQKGPGLYDKILIKACTDVFSFFSKSALPDRKAFRLTFYSLQSERSSLKSWGVPTKS